MQGLQNAANADSAGNVDVLADLGAGADGRPGIHHRALINISADIDVGRHQDSAFGNVGSAANGAGRHGAETGGLELGLAPTLELGRHLVPPLARGHAAGNRAHRIEPEAQQHRFL